MGIGETMKKIFIDCGGHIGESIRLFKRSEEYDSSYKIYSFEPLFENFKVYKDWKDVCFFNSAVWIYDGEINFYIAKSPVSSTLFKEKKTGNVDKDHPIRVKCMDFSQWILNTFDKDDYIILKMDIEGAEFRVLDKMIRDGSIDYINKLYIEWHSNKIDFSDKELYDELIKKLKNCSLELYGEMKKFLKRRG